jgi:anaerobic C4-dicarboxylate transporter
MIVLTAAWLFKYTWREIKESLSMVKVFFSTTYLAETLSYIFNTKLIEDDPISKAKLKNGHFEHQHTRRMEKLVSRVSLVPHCTLRHT